MPYGEPVWCKCGMIGRMLIAALGVLVTARVFAAEPSCPAAPPVHLALPATRAAITYDRPVAIVALGSSSTEGVGASAPDRTYPARLEALLRAHWPNVDVTMRNRGIGGQTIDAVTARLEADVLAVRPTLVIWQVGTNEVLRGMDPERFRALLDEGVRRIVATGSDVVLMDNQLAPRMPPPPGQAIYGSIISREVGTRSISLFSRAALMQAWQAADPTATDMIGPDGLHHSDRGYACLAAALDAAIVASVAEPVDAKTK